MSRFAMTRIFIAATLLSTFAVIFGCAPSTPLPESKSKTPETPATSALPESKAITNNQPTWKVELRPEKSGEIQRRHKIDPDGKERQVHIDLVDKSTIVQSLNELGTVTALSWNNRPDGSKITVAIEEGKIVKVTCVDTRGNVIFQTDKDNLTATSWNENGKPSFSCQMDKESATYILFLADGQTPYVKVTTVNQILEKVEIYRGGKLFYEQRLIVVEKPKPENPLNYQGCFYDSNGKLTYKTSIEGSHLGNWTPKLRRLEELAEDGSVLKSWTFDGSRGSFEERQKLSQSLAGKTINDDLQFVQNLSLQMGGEVIDLMAEVGNVLARLESHSGK